MDDIEELLTLIKNVMVDLVQIESMLTTLQQKGSPEEEEDSSTNNTAVPASSNLK